MSKGKHTPGPWEIERDGKTIETNVCGPIKARFTTDQDKMREEAEANARLIAAAPDLLEACEHMRDHLRDAGYSENRLIMAAIAKARGE